MDWVLGPIPEVMAALAARVARDQADFAAIARSIAINSDGTVTVVYGSAIRCVCGEIHLVSGFSEEDHPIVNCPFAVPGESPMPAVYRNGAIRQIVRR